MSALGSGGTWAGASEQLQRYRWGPLWVRQSDDPAPGNVELLRTGGIAWPDPESAVELRTLLAAGAGKPPSTTPLFPDNDEQAPADLVVPVAQPPSLTADAALPPQRPSGETSKADPGFRSP